MNTRILTSDDVRYHRPLTVSQIKRGLKKNTLERIPKLGLQSRAIWDILMSNGVVNVRQFKNLYSTLTYFRDFYGVDTRYAGNGDYVMTNVLIKP